MDSPPVRPEDENDREPKERYIPPKVIVPLSNARISEGENVLLVCKIDGYPKPKVKAYKFNNLETFFKHVHENNIRILKFNSHLTLKLKIWFNKI